MSKKLVEKNIEGLVIGVSDFETEAEMLAHKEKLILASPESIFEEEDTTEENDKKKNKDLKKKAAKEALKDVDIDGATTIAKLKVIVKLLLESQSE